MPRDAGDDDQWLRLDEPDTGLPADILRRLAARTEHRAADGVPIMTLSLLADAVEMDSRERAGRCCP